MFKEFVICCFFVGLLFAFGVNAQQAKEESESFEYKTITQEEIIFNWRTDENHLYGQISAPTKGWVAVGFGSTEKMKDANIIIGYVDAEGNVHVRDDFGVRTTLHKADDELEDKSGEKDNLNNIIEGSGAETDDKTEIHFTIPLDSGDSKDTKLVPGETYQVILAYGEKDNFKYGHKVRATTEIEL